MQQELLPHLFRTEFRKITSVLCKTFGLAHVEVAEDIASETFLLAYETWSYKGVPENPTAWLHMVARNKAKNYLQRSKIFSDKVANQLRHTTVQALEQIEIDLSSQNITDSQLQMMFAICHPSISTEAQIGLALRILCGFGIDEIADALLTTREAVNKRLHRARARLRDQKIKIEFPPEGEVDKRLDTVLITLYLLFNEGYFSESHPVVLRENLCWEAIRLAQLLTEHAHTDKPAVNALLALMFFHASRFKARKSEEGAMVLYNDQDETLWNRELIARGAYHLHKASSGPTLTKYHLEAGIGYWHTVKADTPEKWENILQLFNKLLLLEYSPVAALNRTYALAKARGKMEAIAEAEKLKLTGNHYYFMLLGELYSDIDNVKSRLNLEKALSIAKTDADKLAIQQKLKRLVP